LLTAGGKCLHCKAYLTAAKNKSQSILTLV